MCAFPYQSYKTMKVKVSVIQSCLTLCDPTDCSPPGSSVHGILKARILEWVAIPSSRGSSQPRDRTQVSCIADSVLSEPRRKPCKAIVIKKKKKKIAGTSLVAQWLRLLALNTGGLGSIPGCSHMFACHKLQIKAPTCFN